MYVIYLCLLLLCSLLLCLFIINLYVCLFKFYVCFLYVYVYFLLFIIDSSIMGMREMIGMCVKREYLILWEELNNE